MGFAFNGLLHMIIGGIAISIAIGAGGGAADQSGALSQLARNPGGVVVLWTIVVGLTALGLWQFLEAFLVPGKDPAHRWAHRIVELSKGVVYIAIAVTAFTFAIGGSSSSSNSSQGASASLLAAPGGVVMLVLGGVVVVIVGVVFVVRGVTRKFTADMRVPAGAAGHAIVALGVFGYVAKGVGVAVVGILFVVAAFTLDPEKASGLDGALKALAALPFGAAILIGVGVGLIAYGLFCVARAKLARL